MGYLSLFVLVFRLLISKFCDKTSATKPFLTITSAQFRFGCICSLCCKLLLFNFATKPFHVTRNAKRPRHNHPIETAIYSHAKNKYVFTCHHVACPIAFESADMNASMQHVQVVGYLFRARTMFAFGFVLQNAGFVFLGQTFLYRGDERKG